MPIDPTGLAIGVVGLAGLFTTCVECFDYVQAGRRYGRDFEVLLTKLEVQKFRFLMWGEMIGIFNPKDSGRDPFLDHPWTGPTIERILGSIQHIFRDTEKIRKRYGLKSLPLASIEHRSPAGLSSNLMKKFQESYLRFLSRSTHLQRESTTATRIRWAIHDRSKFQVFLGDLKDLIDGLVNITPSATNAEDRTMIFQEQINSLSDSASLRLVEEACADSYPDLSEMASLRRASPELRTNHLDADFTSLPYDFQALRFAPDSVLPANHDINMRTAEPRTNRLEVDFNPLPYDFQALRFAPDSVLPANHDINMRTAEPRTNHLEADFNPLTYDFQALRFAPDSVLLADYINTRTAEPRTNHLEADFNSLPYDFQALRFAPDSVLPADYDTRTAEPRTNHLEADSNPLPYDFQAVQFVTDSASPADVNMRTAELQVNHLEAEFNSLTYEFQTLPFRPDSIPIDVNTRTPIPPMIDFPHEDYPVPFPITDDFYDACDLSELMQLQQRSAELEEEIASLQAHITKIETVPLAMQLDAQSLSSSYDMPRLEVVVHSWAFRITERPQVPLDMICDSIFVDSSQGQMESTPWRARSLLRSAMMEVVSEMLFKNIVFTNRPNVDGELTRIYERIFDKNSTAASFWLRSTLSVIDYDQIPLSRELLRDRFPTLTKILSPIDDTRILETALSISRKLCSLSASSNTLHRSFTPLLGSNLNFEEAVLTERCLRKERGLNCKVGAVICMGLVKVTRGAVYPGGDMGNHTAVIQKPKIICYCALVPQAAEKGRPSISADVLSAWRPLATSPEPGPSRSRQTPLAISYISTPQSPNSRATPSSPTPPIKSLPSRPLTPDPVPPYPTDSNRKSLAETSFAAAGLSQTPQSTSPSLRASSRASYSDLPNGPVRPCPHCQSSHLMTLDVSDRVSRPSNDIRDDSQNESNVAVALLSETVFRLVKEVTVLKTQVQALQLASASENAANADSSLHLEPGTSACDIPPPYLSSQ